MISQAINRLPFVLGEILDWPTAIYPNKGAIETDTHVVTYKALLRQVLWLTKRFIEPPFSRGQRWAVAVQDPLELVPSLIALARAGCVAAPYRKIEAQGQIDDLFDRNNFTGVLAPPASRTAARLQASSDIESTVIADNLTAYRRTCGETTRCEFAGVSQVIDLDSGLIIWSSGSTRKPRGVVFQHHAVLANIWANIKALGYCDNDRTLLVLPLAHAYGLVHQCFCHLAIGATVCVPGTPLSAPMLIRSLERFKVTTVATVPLILQMMIDGIERVGYSPSHLRLVTIGTAPTPIRSLRKLQDQMPNVKLATTYGLTEAGPRVCTHMISSQVDDETCVGTPLPNTEILLMRANKRNQQEICIRSRSRMESYSDQEKPSSDSSILPTGDVGEIQNGRLHVIGRLSHAAEHGDPGVEIIRRALERHPSVNSAIVSVMPGDSGTGSVEAIVHVNSESRVSESELKDFCKQHLVDRECPSKIIICEQTTTSGSKEDHLISVIMGS